MAILETTRELAERSKKRPRTREWNPYVIRQERFGPVYDHIRKHAKSKMMAMDDSSPLSVQNQFAIQAWQTGGIGPNDATDGMLFLGYPYLSELSQRAEFRLFGEITSEEMTRKWIDLRGTDDESTKEKDKPKDRNKDDQEAADRRIAMDAKPRTDGQNKEIERKIIELRQFADELRLRQWFKSIDAQDQYFGISHLYLDLKGADVNDLYDPENKISIGNGRNAASKEKLGRNCLKGLRTIEPVWCYPIAYNANNPLSPDWYDPLVWYVMGAEVHKTRLIPFISRPVADILKPAYAFGGLPMTQMAQPYVDIWLRTRESVSELIHAFSVMILKTNIGTITQPGGSGGAAGDVIARMMLANTLRDNQGMMIIDKNTEDFANVAAPISGLDHLQAQAQEHMYSVARIPAVKWTGIQPTGLNATSEGELRAFNDTIHGRQESFFRNGLTTILDIMQISLWGARDPDITYDFEPLHELTEKEKADARKVGVETDQILVDTGIVSQEEVRAKLVADPDSGFHGLDPDDVPELLEEEEQGLIPEGAGKGLQAELEEGGGTPGGAVGRARTPGKPPSNDNEGRRRPAQAQDEIDPLSLDAGWNESDHPRRDDGKFGSGGGGSSVTAPSHKPLKAAELKRVGKQIGSNPGGVFEDKSGERYYVKKGKSKAHVRNELAAVALYQLAGVSTLEYRPVEGGEHIASKMSKLEKDNANKFSPAEVKQAQQDFMTHAWLANWDAAGLGGDNLGIIGGKVTALDVGGALTYRAMGAPKGVAFGTKVGEIDTLRDKNVNRDTAKLFGQMTPAELKASAEKVTNIRDGAIRAAVRGAGEGEELAEKLIARKHDIAEQFGLGAAGDMTLDDGEFEEAKHPRKSDGKFAPKGGGEASGGKEDKPLWGLYATGGTPKENHEKTLNKFLQGKPKGTKPEAVVLATLIKEAPNFGTSDKVPGLQVQLAASLYAAQAKANEQNKIDKANAIGKQIAKMEKLAPKSVKSGFELHAGTSSVTAEPPKPPEKIEAPKPTPEFPKPTPEEAKKAAKGVPLKMQYVPGNKPTSGAFLEAGELAVKGFNDKWSGKELSDPKEIAQKVAHFKAVGVALNHIAQQQQAAEAVAKQEAAEKAKQAANKAAAELEKKKAAAAETNKKVMQELGITETEALGFKALADMHGSGGVDLVEKFKHYEKAAQKANYPISGFQYALLMNYIDGGYSDINAALRSGSLTLAQHVYTKMMNDALEKLPKYTGMLQRGTHLDQSQIAQYKEGHVVKHGSFTSAGVGFKFGGNVHYKIKATGKRGADVQTVNPGEKEIIFKANTMFLVHKVTEANGKTIIEMEEVDSYG